MNMWRTRSGYTPYVTWAIMLICLLVPTLTLVRWIPATGALTWQLVYAPLEALIQPWRLVTAGFVHGGYLHLLFNMVAFWVAAKQLEELFGHARFACVWLVSTAGGYVFALALSVFIPALGGAGVTIGASGGILALFAIFLMLQRGAGGDISALAVMLGLTLAYGIFVSGISWQVHLGGIIVGLILGGGFVMIGKRVYPEVTNAYDAVEIRRTREAATRKRHRLQALLIGGVALAEVAIWGMCYASTLA
ncbi:rhomboid family intramembrane serine protease [Nanchangia anserum]|uniref:Rhomboid family intramembrane serine protease n=1 Tax=Nanchangia anserum TaxID=2692125 RepID=A0A8I0G992_9ACTO|nr:rhomboid family intramembrane serine protease [Nanchangia anserum]MBD3689504.1 rhomboid family intramembrane serine protease [Nanchangia anserum]QOX81693.1 rhomboid family intramembrane serine protease [Nanchangia anserum]